MGSEAPLSSWGAGGTSQGLSGVWLPAPPSLGTRVLRVLGGPAFYRGQLQEGGGGRELFLCQLLSQQPKSSDAMRSRGRAAARLDLDVSALLHWVLSPHAISGHALSAQRSGPKLSFCPDAH